MCTHGSGGRQRCSLVAVGQKESRALPCQKAIPVLLKLSVLHVPETPIENYIAYIQSDETARIAYVLEIMDNITFKKDRELITPLLEQTSIGERCLSGRRHFADLPQDLDAELVNFIQASNEWRSVATLGIFQNSQIWS